MKDYALGTAYGGWVLGFDEFMHVIGRLIPQKWTYVLSGVLTKCDKVYDG